MKDESKTLKLQAPRLAPRARHPSYFDKRPDRGPGGQERLEIGGVDAGGITAREKVDSGLTEGFGDKLSARESTGRGVIQVEMGEDVLEDDDQRIPPVIFRADLRSRPLERRVSFTSGRGNDRAVM